MRDFEYLVESVCPFSWEDLNLFEGLEDYVDNLNDMEEEND